MGDVRKAFRTEILTLACHNDLSKGLPLARLSFPIYVCPTVVSNGGPQLFSIPYYSLFFIIILFILFILTKPHGRTPVKLNYFTT